MRSADIHGFDPDPAEVARLNVEAEAQGLPAKYYPHALWSASGRFPFHENNAPGGGSFYEQNRALTDRWKFECVDGQKTPSRGLFYPTTVSDIDAVSLDDWAKQWSIPRVDFLKMNIQGAELEVLCGANGMVANVLGVLAEVSFVESYRNRPMFSDIDQFLRRAGFEFFDLLHHHPVGRIASPIEAVHMPALRSVSHGQLIEAHALYLRDPLRAGASPWAIPEIVKLAMLAEAFGQVEYAFELVASMGESGASVFTAGAAAYLDEYGLKVAA